MIHSRTERHDQDRRSREPAGTPVLCRSVARLAGALEKWFNTPFRLMPGGRGISISIQYVAKQDSCVARGVARRYATLFQ